MRGVVTSIDSNFTHVRTDAGELQLYNHKAENACPLELRKPGTTVDLVHTMPDALTHCRPAGPGIHFDLPPDPVGEKGAALAGKLAANMVETMSHVPVKKRGK